MKWLSQTQRIVEIEKDSELTFMEREQLGPWFSTNDWNEWTSNFVAYWIGFWSIKY